VPSYFILQGLYLHFLGNIRDPELRPQFRLQKEWIKSEIGRNMSIMPFALEGFEISPFTSSTGRKRHHSIRRGGRSDGIRASCLLICQTRTHRWTDCYERLCWMLRTVAKTQSAATQSTTSPTTA
jgi:hypothetical protein